MNAEWNSLPMVNCPHCGREFQWDDYYDIAPGTEHDCPRCEKTIFVKETDIEIKAKLSTEP